MVNYLHRDHLGSVDIITDHTGAVIQRMSFDAWGKRREINWQAMNESAIAAFDTAITTRGFTGHEQLDPVGLTHMNGRFYDAELGRFLSADPHIQALDNLQNFNRYSYVLNNPLSYTDPTGFFFAKLFKAIGKAFGKIFSAIGRALKKLLRNPIVRALLNVVACTFGGPAGCAAAAGASTVASGGSIRDAILAVAFSFVGGVVDTVMKGASIVARAIVKGAISGASAVARGGNFLAGFASGAISAIGGGIAKGLATPVARTIVAAITGCASAVVSGGKCVNGAVTAAFANMLAEVKRAQSMMFRRDGISKDKVSKIKFAIRNYSQLRGVDKAGYDVTYILNRYSIAENREYLTVLYQHDDGTIGMTKPNSSHGSVVGIGDSFSRIPTGTVVVGILHTHGDYSWQHDDGTIERTGKAHMDNLDSDKFSYHDIGMARGLNNRFPGIVTFLGTPSGTIYRYSYTDKSGNFKVLP